VTRQQLFINAVKPLTLHTLPLLLRVSQSAIVCFFSQYISWRLTAATAATDTDKEG
jgi:hypothetical protein